MARSRDLPLDQDGSARFLPWLVALMVYLAALTIAGGAALHDAVQTWDAGLAGTLTVELPRGANGAAVPQDRVDATLKLLGQIPGVAQATRLDGPAETRLLAPWLGQDVDVSALPLPIRWPSACASWRREPRSKATGPGSTGCSASPAWSSSGRLRSWC